MNVTHLKERIAISPEFTAEERYFVLDAINEAVEVWRGGVSNVGARYTDYDGNTVPIEQARMLRGREVKLTDVREPHIVVNGIELSTAQAMALRVACSCFTSEMGAPDALGGDLHGRTMARAYRDRLLEVFRIMVPS